MRSINYPYANFLRDVDRIITWLKPQRKGYTRYGITPWDPDCVVSINRGGLVPGVYLSHALEVPHYPIHYQTKDVPPGALGIERNDQKNIEGYMDRKNKKGKK